jgi:hypothetical protein
MLVLLCSFGFGRRSRPTGRHYFLAVNVRAMSLSPDLSEICFIETNEAILAAFSMNASFTKRSFDSGRMGLQLHEKHNIS